MDLIKKLVKKSIDEGILERRPDRQVEHWMERPLIPGVTMVGKIDLKLPGEIQDHKSTKAMKWAKTEKKDSPNYLGKSEQMLDYAYEAIADDPDLEVVRLRHNVFCKDPAQPIARKVDVTVTRAVVAANWNRLKKQAKRMKDLAELELPERDWQKVEGPNEPDACQAFGGCPFRRICGGIESPAQYRQRTNRQLKQQKNHKTSHTWAEAWGSLEKATSDTSPGSDNDVDIFEKRTAKAKAKAKTNGSPKAAAQPLPIDGSEAAVAPAETATVIACAPPWAQSGCPACKGLGFNKKGNACRICDSQSKKAGGPVSSNYVIDTDGVGNISWEAKDGTGGGAAALEEAAAEPKVQERIELPEAPLDQKDETEVAPAERDIFSTIIKANGEATETAEEEVAEKAKKKADKVLPVKKTKKPKAPDQNSDAPAEEKEPRKNAGRPKNGYYLYIDCMPVGVETVSAENLFAELAAELAAEMKVESYYDLDVYKRRESFVRVLTSEVLDERFNKLHIVARNPQGAPDLRAFIDAIVAVASKGHVIQGVR